MEHEDPAARHVDHEPVAFRSPVWDGVQGAQHQQPPSHDAAAEGHHDNMDDDSNDDGAAVGLEEVRRLLREMLGEVAHGVALRLEDVQKRFKETFQISLNRSFATSLGYGSVKPMLDESCSDICKVCWRRKDVESCKQIDLYRAQSNRCESSSLSMGPMLAPQHQHRFVEFS